MLLTACPVTPFGLGWEIYNWIQRGKSRYLGRLVGGYQALSHPGGQVVQSCQIYQVGTGPSAHPVGVNSGSLPAPYRARK